ncbi:YopX family protein [Streptococcus suis]|uniref:YopX family protein n=1 Tax=Streptococcus suis TaxID=1307 RepID=UPI000CF5956E|nr:YopX family protein [Streptococcus suis]
MIPKFRAYNPATNDWYKPEEVFVSDGNIYLDDDDFDELTQNNDVTLMQSTGLFDKNGKEIFEGDVVLQNGWKKVAVSFGTQEVEENFGDKRIFQGFNLYLGGGYPEAVMCEFEIIGNIYENPELMEGVS